MQLRLTPRGELITLLRHERTINRLPSHASVPRPLPIARLLAAPALIAAIALLAGCGSGSAGSRSSASAANGMRSSASAANATTVASTSANPTIGPEGIPEEQGPPLAPASSTARATTVDGVQCAAVEQLDYHIHAHLQVYDDGQPRQLPPAIGLVGPVAEQTPNGPFYGAQTCYYWLHTHAGDGIIHIESPTPRIYTLGQFFDEWRQPLSFTQVGPDTGPVTAFVNGKRWSSNPRTIPITAHAMIQLDVGTPVVPFQTVSFAGTRL